jgi:hypothetical protein
VICYSIEFKGAVSTITAFRRVREVSTVSTNFSGYMRDYSVLLYWKYMKALVDIT